MKKLAEVTVGGVRVVVSELDVAQVERMITMIRNQAEPTTLDWLFADTFMPERVLQEIIGRPVQEVLQVGELAPSELEPLYEKALAVNPFLAKALAKMSELAELERSLARGLMEEITGGGLAAAGLEKPDEKTTTAGSGSPPSS
ncbi:MAG: hypothetical protein KQH59_18490 [Desulfobulbaceae bacterium]|nr:hypothetical protein [Desulfobulbaceae bacterium]